MTETPTLVLDASSAQIQCGIRGSDKWMALNCREGETLESLFPLVETTLSEAGIDKLSALRSIAFCSGPGSILGLRLSAMAIETWCALHPQLREQLYTFSSLEALALQVRATHGLESFHILTDFRRGHFNHLAVTNTSFQSPALLPVGDAARLDGPVFYCAQRRVRNPVPEHATVVTMSIRELFDFPECGILHPSLRADVTVPENPEFAKWEAARHRAPGTESR